MKRRGMMIALILIGIALLTVVHLIVPPRLEISGPAYLDEEILKKFSFRKIGASIEKGEYRNPFTKQPKGSGWWSNDTDSVYLIDINDEATKGSVVVAMPIDGENSAIETFEYYPYWYRPYELNKRSGHVDENRTYPEFTCVVTIRSQNGWLWMGADGTSIDACVHNAEQFLLNLMPE